MILGEVLRRSVSAVLERIAILRSRLDGTEIERLREALEERDRFVYWFRRNLAVVERDRDAWSARVFRIGDALGVRGSAEEIEEAAGRQRAEVERLADLIYLAAGCDREPEPEQCRHCDWRDSELCSVSGREIYS